MIKYKNLYKSNFWSLLYFIKSNVDFINYNGTFRILTHFAGCTTTPTHARVLSSSVHLGAGACRQLSGPFFHVHDRLFKSTWRSINNMQMTVLECIFLHHSRKSRQLYYIIATKSIISMIITNTSWIYWLIFIGYTNFIFILIV